MTNGELVTARRTLCSLDHALNTQWAKLTSVCPESTDGMPIEKVFDSVSHDIEDGMGVPDDVKELIAIGLRLIVYEIHARKLRADILECEAAI